jgi:hypothetical protein
MSSASLTVTAKRAWSSSPEACISNPFHFVQWQPRQTAYNLAISITRQYRTDSHALNYACNKYCAMRDNRVHQKSLHESMLNFRAGCMPTTDVCASPDILPLASAISISGHLSVHQKPLEVLQSHVPLACLINATRPKSCLQLRRLIVLSAS